MSSHKSGITTKKPRPPTCFHCLLRMPWGGVYSKLLWFLSLSVLKLIFTKIEPLFKIIDKKKYTNMHRFQKACPERWYRHMRKCRSESGNKPQEFALLSRPGIRSLCWAARGCWGSWGTTSSAMWPVDEAPRPTPPSASRPLASCVNSTAGGYWTSGWTSRWVTAGCWGAFSIYATWEWCRVFLLVSVWLLLLLLPLCLFVTLSQASLAILWLWLHSWHR